ncbi:tRNA pseudouridine(55) synthase TruB [Leptolyngbya sp. GB1-A1]|uniref:tRNA pseudouridine(55) synthase TruB n=2 Tax=Leptolyngbya TaxID=47251 RepID=UPI0019C230AA|nr:tRNA pseudouridine(55) synthase TruB [Cyanobacteria bacterium FACHB-502]
MHGFLNLNKPAGLTSHDCVARLRKLLRTKKVGHGGTLDPAATGVLPIAVGKATRLLQYLSHQKSYRATVRFGLRTTTDDLEGEVLSQFDASGLTQDQVKAALPKFQGTIAQIPPSYSAIQVGGKRLYELARSGETVEAPVRTVQIDRLEILDWRPGEYPELDLAIDCGTGTYIRSIARDLGDVLGTGGTLAKLLRTRSSDFFLQDSLSLEAVAAQMEANALSLMPPSIALGQMPIAVLNSDQTLAWSQGKRLSLEQIQIEQESSYFQVQNQSGQFLGIGQVLTEANAQPNAVQDHRLLQPKLVWDISTR